MITIHLAAELVAEYLPRENNRSLILECAIGCPNLTRGGEITGGDVKGRWQFFCVFMVRRQVGAYDSAPLFRVLRREGFSFVRYIEDAQYFFGLVKSLKSNDALEAKAIWSGRQCAEPYSTFSTAKPDERNSVQTFHRQFGDQ